jgi:raffinose/stachyose/melibiose transport system permease protein
MTAKVHPRAKISGAARILCLGVAAILLVGFPLWMVLVNSFKGQGEAAELSLGLPQVWKAVSNYGDVLTQSKYGVSFLSSLLVTSCSVAALLAIGAPAAWAFARSKSRALKAIYSIAIVGVLLPPAVIPAVFMLRSVGLQGSQLGLILFSVGTRISLVVFLMTGFARGLPKELEEAAAVDGAGRLRTFTSVVLPLMMPVVQTVFVIVTVLTWNDFYAPLFLLSGDNATLPLGLYQLSSGISQATAWNYVFAHVVLVSLPLIFLYALVQRKIVEGVTAGAIRG